MRKLAIGLMVGAFFAVAAIALAANNTVDYKSTVTYKGKPKKNGTNTAYEGILNVATTDGTQPDVAPNNDVFFAKQLKNNATKFKSCKVSDLNGKTAAPAKCKSAQVGGGTATAYVGQAGQPLNPATKQNLKVTAYNGPKGKQLLLALSGGALPTIRVIPGDISGASAPFGYKVTFKVPTDLQGSLGAQIALTNFDVQISASKTAKVVKKRGKTKTTSRVSYLQVTGCPASKTLPTRAIVHFNKDDNTSGGEDKQSDGTMACH